jgi:two-component system, NarL family, invasion response regulator UvrY
MRVFIVEDDESMRFVLRRLLLKNFPSIVAIAESDTAEDALEALPTFGPDLALVDISLPGMSGIEMIHQLKPRCPRTRFLVVTGHEIDLYKRVAEKAGADGIVSKSEHGALLNAIRERIRDA